jgi:hypothetical protein
MFDHSDEALELLRKLEPGHGVDTRDGRTYTEVMADGLGDIARRLNNLAARGFIKPQPMMRPIHGEPSFQLVAPEVDLHITVRGGHLAPVVFHLPGRDVSPYSLPPWESAEFPDILPLFAVLRGDFLCLPFGEQIDGPLHGEAANGVWTLLAADARTLHLSMDAEGHFEKIITTRPGQHAIYSEHRISNLDGDFNYGNHPILNLSGLPEEAGRVTVSPFRWASVFPGTFSNPDAEESQALAEGARFTDLREVPLAAGGTTDLTKYPARAGNEDVVMMVSAAATPEQPFAWSAAVLDGYVWFSLKNPVDFPATLFWLSNGGRTEPPWNGRHLGRIGIEEVCSYFCHGVALSRQDLLAAEGIPTTRCFKHDEIVSLKTIQAVAAVHSDFGAISKILPAGDEAVTLVGESGARVTVPVSWKFLF